MLVTYDGTPRWRKIARIDDYIVASPTDIRLCMASSISHQTQGGIKTRVAYTNNQVLAHNSSLASDITLTLINFQPMIGLNRSPKKVKHRLQH